MGDKLKYTIFFLLGISIFILAHQKKSYQYKYDLALQDLDEANKAFNITTEQIETLTNKNDELKKQIKEFKDVEAVTIIQTNTVIDTVVFSVPNTSIDSACNFVSQLVIDTTFYSFDFTYTQKDFTINKLSIPNKLSIVVGDKKIKGWTGITKGKEYTIDVSSSNPYVNTVNIQNYKIVDEKKWYETKWFLIGAGFVGGVLIAK